MNQAQLRAEDERVNALQRLVARAAARIRSGKLTLAEAIHLAEHTRHEAELLIPDQMNTYDLIYESRLTRLAWQFAARKDA